MVSLPGRAVRRSDLLVALGLSRHGCLSGLPPRTVDLEQTKCSLLKFGDLYQSCEAGIGAQILTYLFFYILHLSALSCLPKCALFFHLQQ